MASVTLKGNPVQLEGKLPEPGDPAPDFSLVGQDLSEITLNHFGDKVKVFVAVPSLDTAVCAKEAKEFNTKMGQMPGVQTMVVSGDLPFAMKRYCAAEGVDNLVMASQFRNMSFSRAYGTHIADGGLKDLSARAVFVVGPDNKVAYTQLVPEIGQEPDYDAVEAEVKKLL